MIHTIGDSHSKFPWEKIPGVKVHWLRAILAFTAGRDGLKRVNISNIGLKPNDSIIFCFGEIDCRGHIHKHLTKDNTYQKQIDLIVKKYFDTIKLNKDLIKFNINICIFNVVPPYPQDKKKDGNNPEWPFVGTDNQRKSYVNYFNQKLKEYCLKNNYIFIDVYNEYADNEGFLNIPLSDGNVHIGNPKYIIDFINKHNL